MTRATSWRRSALYLLGALLLSLVALRSNATAGSAAVTDSDDSSSANMVSTDTNAGLDASTLSFSEKEPPPPPDPGGETIPGTTWACVYSPDVNESYVPSPVDLGLYTRQSATNITIVYAGAWPVDAQAAFERAVATWENLVDTTAPIRISATWGNLGSGGILGQGGPALWRDFTGAPQPATWYPAALGNALCGCDLGGAGDFEMYITMNSAFPDWFYGPGAAPGNKVDFETTSLHEVTHGFGFAGTARVNSGSGLGTYGTSGYPTAYDRFTEDNAGTPILSYTNSSVALAAALQSNAVFFDGPNTRTANGGNRAGLHAPATWVQGSSYSHLSNAFDSTADAIITYALSYGETIHDLGPVTKGVFQDIGWPLAAVPPPTGSLQFSSATYNVGEATATLNIPVARLAGTSGAASATCSVTGGTATGSGTDYTLTANAVSWADGDSATKSCVLSIVNDTAFEPDETVIITLTAITGASAGTIVSTTATIQSNDPAVPGALQFSAATYLITEGTATLNVPVTRTGGSDGAASATCAVSAGGTATTGTDFSLSTSAVSWTNGEATTKNCVITVTNDTAYEVDETANLALQSITGATAGSPTSTVVTIVSNDAATPGTLQFSSATYSVTEGTATLNVPLTRTGGTDLAASATCSVSGGTAATPPDYTLSTSSVSWAHGDGATKNCVISVVNDPAFEANETVLLDLTSITGATAGTPASTTVTIVSNDAAAPGTLQFSASTFSVSEATATLDVVVTRSGGSDGAASATCAVTSGSATGGGTDYALTTSSVTWVNGDALSKNCVITLTNDLVFEANETVVIALQGVTGATAGSPGSMTVTITSDDAAQPGVLQFSATTYSASESSGTLSIPVTRTGGSDGAVGVTCAVNGGGTATGGGTDYTLTTASVSWANGDSVTKNCVITIVNETTVEGDETILLALQSATGGATIGATNEATATITNDDNAGTIQFTAATFGPFAESAGTVSLSLSRTGGTSGTTGATCSIGGASTASTPGDFSLATSVVSWTNGDAANKSCTVSIVDDVNQEGAESIVLQVAVTSGQGVLGAQSSANANITDNDNAGTVQFASATYSVSEGGTFVDLGVARTGGTSGAVGITCVFTGGTASGGDYTLTSATLSWANGESGTKSCRVTPVNESTVEPDETLLFELQSATGDVAIGAQASTTVSITNDDSAGALQFTGATFAVGENGTFVDVTVSRTGGTSGVASASCAVTGGTASAGDYTLTNAALSWANGEGGNKSCRITPVQDSIVEPDETVELSLTAINGAAAGSPGLSTISVTNDDSAGTLQFTESSFSVSEGGTFIDVTVSRSGGTSGPASASCAATGGTAQGGDFSLTNAAISWADGEGGTKSCRIAPIQDSDVEPDETVTLSLGNVTGAGPGSLLSTTVTITNDDSAGTLQFTAATFAAVGESSGTATFSVSRTGGTSGAASATCSIGSGSAASPADYTLSGATLAWDDGDGATKQCTIEIVNDTSVESSETVILLLGGASGASLGSTVSAARSITDDDNAGVISFGAVSYGTLAEDSGFIDLVVRRTGGSSGAVGASCLTSGGTASTPADFTISPATVSWANGDAADKTCRINIAGDSLVEATETVSVQLQDISGQATLGAPATTTLSITDDDNAGVLQFEASTFSITENGAFAEVTVLRTGGTSGAVGISCQFVAGGSASSADYTLSNMVLSWTDGEGGAKACRVTPVDDDVVEADESLILQLVNATGGAVIGAPAAAGVYITNDDSAGTLAFVSANLSGDEDGGAIIITVSRTGGNKGSVFAACSVITGGSASAADYSISGALNWANGDSANKTCTLIPVNDAEDEDDETVVIQLVGPTGGALISESANIATVTIADDDTAPAALEFLNDIPDGASGEPFAQQPMIQLRDANGEPITTSTAVVTLSIEFGNGPAVEGAILICESGVSVAAVNGVAEFSGCRIEAVGGALGVRIRATALGLTQAESEPFDVFDTLRDATCDGQVNVVDALAVLRALAGYEDGVLPAAPCTGNFDGDAGLSIMDVLAMRRFAAGLD